MQTIQLPIDNIIEQDRETIQELIKDYLNKLDIQAKVFDWSIEIQYMEGK